MRTMTSVGLQPFGGQAHLRQSRCVCFHPDCSCVCVQHLKLIYYPLIDKAYSSLLRVPRLCVPLLVGEYFTFTVERLIFRNRLPKRLTRRAHPLESPQNTHLYLSIAKTQMLSSHLLLLLSPLLLLLADPCLGCSRVLSRQARRIVEEVRQTTLQHTPLTYGPSRRYTCRPVLLLFSGPVSRNPRMFDRASSHVLEAAPSPCRLPTPV